ncbi:MAG: hypothetical protein IT304_05850 [Dehalococcoidia bacterium]|nr:hypothetical protein [Dehalococcoidia bacterium]
MLETAERAPAPGAGRRRWQQRLPRDRAFAVALACAVLLGVGVRAYHVLRWDFPLNDGGLFYQMARDLQDNGYRLPPDTTYNGANIPFGYPPLGMYVAAAVADATPFGLLTLFRILPLLATAATVGAFALLARRLVPSRAALLAATLAFAFVPRSFDWLLMGGGVTRSFGLLFALLALHEGHRMFTERRVRFAASTALLSALTVLSHLETGWFLACSMALLFLCFGRSRRAMLLAAVAGVAVVALTAPWWATVLAHDGLDTFRDANASGGSAFSDPGVRGYVFVSLGRFVSTSEPWFPLIGTLGLLGALASLVTRRLFLPAWWALTIVLDPRAFPTFTTVPVAVLAGVGIVEVIVPALQRLRSAVPAPSGNGAHDIGRPAAPAILRAPAGWALAFFFVYSFTGSLVTKPGLATENDQLRPVSRAERDLMAWIRVNTAPDSRFLILPRSSWETDREGEWFPVLADRVSVATVQGFEWTPLFNDQVDTYYRAFECGFRTVTCLDDWRVDTGRDFTHIWVPRERGLQCCSTLLAALRRDSRFATLYDGPGGTVFVRTEGPQPLPPWPPREIAVRRYEPPPPPAAMGSGAGSLVSTGTETATRRLPFSATR